MSDTLPRVLVRGGATITVMDWRHIWKVITFGLVLIATSGFSGSGYLLAQTAENQAVLSGRIVDDQGSPVTDATINLMGKARQADGSTDYQTTKTDADGRYAFESVAQMDAYRVRIESTRCVGLTNWRALPELQLSPLSNMTRDFELPRACVIRIQVVDEQGKAVEGVNVYAAPLSSELFVNASSNRTDKEGWATVGGLAPSEQQYLFGTMHDDYAFAKLIKKLDDPEQEYAEKIVVSPGSEVRGVALCSDGKPAVGWTVNAMPKWWNFGSHPRGVAIDHEGNFTLPHVIPGKYNVHVSIPTGEGMFRQHNALTDAELPPSSGVLELKLSVPSPRSMGAITGIVKVEGPPRTESIWVHARSEDGKHSGNGNVAVGEREFRISPLPPGRYTLTFNSTEVEQVRIDGIQAPTDEVDVTLKSFAKPRISGSVVRADTKEPIQHFRVRVMKVGYLRGPGYVQDSNWQAVDDPAGLFSLEVVGPGIYQVMVDAQGLAPAKSEPINTDEYDGDPLWLELSEGVTLRGTVTDERGDPVDGATVTTSTYSIGLPNFNQGSTVDADKPVRTVAGKFQIPHLPAGEVMLTVKHPDYCTATTKPITVEGSNLDIDPIILAAGGSVEGRVYDSSGKPEANVTLYVQLRSRSDELGRLVTMVTDQNGDYTARHLPEELCEVRRAEEWNTLGVVRNSFLPVNGEVSRVDLGGPVAATGRLLIDGEPLRNERVQLGGGNANFGVYKAYAQTDNDGNFTFWGPAPSKRVLYYRAPGTRSDWIRAREVVISPEELASDIFGDIDVRDVTLTVPVTGVTEDDLSKMRMTLNEYNPRWPFGNDAGVLQSRQQVTDPFVFEFVPPGRYELVCRRADNLSLRQLIDVTAESPELSVPVEWPAKTGTLTVRFDKESFSKQENFQPPNLWSVDGKFHATVYSDGGNEVRYEKLPAGDYYLAKADTRNPPRILEFSVAPGAEKLLELTEENYQPPPRKMGIVVVLCFTSDGVVLEGCDIDLQSDTGSIQESSSQYGRTSMIGDPGEYTMTVSFPGFQAIQRQVTIQPVGPDGRAVGNVSVNVRLVRTGDKAGQ